MSAAAREHPGNQPPRELDRRQQVELDDRLVFSPGHLVELLLRVTACIVHEHIDPSKRFLSSGCQLFDAFRIGEVGRNRHHLGAFGQEHVCLSLELRSRAAGQDQLVAGLGQGTGDVRPDASRSTRDKGNLGCSVHLRDLLWGGAPHALGS